MPNGPALSLARVSALFHCPPLNNITKIKLSQQTTKPRVEFDGVLHTVRRCHHTYQDGREQAMKNKKIIFRLGFIIAGNSKITLDNKLFGKSQKVCQYVCNFRYIFTFLKNKRM